MPNGSYLTCMRVSQGRACASGDAAQPLHCLLAPHRRLLLEPELAKHHGGACDMQVAYVRHEQHAVRKGWRVGPIFRAWVGDILPTPSHPIASPTK